MLIARFLRHLGFSCAFPHGYCHKEWTPCDDTIHATWKSFWQNCSLFLSISSCLGFFCRPNLIFPTCLVFYGILRKALYGWGRIFVVTGDPAAYQVRADARQHLFSHSFLTSSHHCHFLSKPVSTERSTILNQKDMGKHSRFVSTHSCNWNQATAMLPKFSQMHRLHRFYKFQSGACDRFWRKSTSGTFRTSALPQKLLAPMNRVGQTSRASWSLGLQKLIIVDHGRSNSVSHTCSEMNARRMFFYVWNLHLNGLSGIVPNRVLLATRNLSNLWTWYCKYMQIYQNMGSYDFLRVGKLSLVWLKALTASVRLVS